MFSRKVTKEDSPIGTWNGNEGKEGICHKSSDASKNDHVKKWLRADLSLSQHLFQYKKISREGCPEHGIIPCCIPIEPLVSFRLVVKLDCVTPCWMTSTENGILHCRRISSARLTELPHVLNLWFVQLLLWNAAVFNLLTSSFEIAKTKQGDHQCYNTIHANFSDSRCYCYMWKLLQNEGLKAWSLQFSSSQCSEINFAKSLYSNRSEHNA